MESSSSSTRSLPETSPCSDEKVRFLLHTGGRWVEELTMKARYYGKNIKTYELEVPSNLRSFSVLMDMVKRVSGLDYGERSRLSYKSGRICLCFGVRPGDKGETGYGSCRISMDIHLADFMDHVVKKRSQPIDLYLECR